jgi:hypothetical protein
MTALSYAPPLATPPRYGRLALGSALLLAACMVLFLLPLVTRLLLARFAPVVSVYRWSQLVTDGLAYLLVIPAIIAFATFRRATRQTHIILWPTLATVHLALALTIYLVAATTSFSPPLPPIAILIIAGYIFDQLLLLMLLIAALVFVIRLHITPITILAMSCFAPAVLHVPMGLGMTLISILSLKGLTLQSYYLTIYQIFMYNTPILACFWLTLMILALVLAAKSRTALIGPAAPPDRNANV